MADIFSKEKRSAVMGRIKGKNTKPEMIVRSMLHKNGYRFRLHKAGLPGKPDIVLSKYRTVIFVHGCYWHRHADCKRGQSMPSSNIDFWQNKFTATVERDKKNQELLEKVGWKVLIIWQCEISDKDALMKKLISEL